MTREEAAKMIKDDMRLHHDYLSGEYRKALKIAIEALEQPEQQWIPVSEKLPKKAGHYLVCGKGNIWVCEFCFFDKVGGWANLVLNPVVTAWMPLPEPYGGEQE